MYGRQTCPNFIPPFKIDVNKSTLSVTIFFKVCFSSLHAFISSCVLGFFNVKLHYAPDNAADTATVIYYSLRLHLISSLLENE